MTEKIKAFSFEGGDSEISGVKNKGSVFMKSLFSKMSDALQLLGRSMLLAISVMPAAAILNRIADDDLLNIPFLKEAAWTIFAIIPILFAISIAGGIAKDKNVAAGLSGVIVYEILVRTLIGNEEGINSFGRVAVENVDNNILIGIIAGIIAGVSYEKFKNKELPNALSFFSGRRLVAIMASLFAIVAALVLAFVFPVLDRGIYHVGVFIGEATAGPFFFSFLNRLLIPTGLHHIINSYIQFQLPSALPEFAEVAGEIPRFFSGDPTAGTYMSGAFSMMMFGLPGAALAMYKTAREENKQKVKGLLLGAAFTSFLTGITEPIEFSFIFISPVLFVLHATLAGLNNVISNIFNVGIVGVGGAGLIDYILQFNQATNALFVPIVGAITFVFYYFTFTFFIKKLDIQTPGREKEAIVSITEEIPEDEKAAKILELLGGEPNIRDLDNCITRLRLEVEDMDMIDVEGLKQLGMREVVKLKNGKVHVIVGLEVEQLAPKIKALM